MKTILHRQDYEQSKNLFEPQYLEWDAKKKIFINTNKKNFDFCITSLEKMPIKQKDEILEVMNKWKEEIEEDDEVKSYDHRGPNYSRVLYQHISNYIINILINYKDITSDNEKNDLNYVEDFFCCTIKNKNDYLSIAIFSMPKDKKGTNSMLELSVACPSSQTNKEARKNGTIGACGHNSRVTMINYIFSQKNINKIYSNPANYSAGKALEKLGFIEAL